MPKCVYCGKEYEFPKGITLVANKGNINYLCSSKCKKNMAMKRRKVRWISKKKKVKDEVKKFRKKFLELGGFDEIYYPAYFEDIALGYGARKRLWF